MIHPAFNKSEIARRYFEIKGYKLSKQEAANRWRMLRNPDKSIIKKVIDRVYKEQLKLLLL